MCLYLQLSSSLCVLAAIPGLWVSYRDRFRGSGFASKAPFYAALCSWAIAYFLWLSTSDADSALVLSRISIACAGFIGPGLIIFMGAWVPALRRHGLSVVSYLLAVTHAMMVVGSDLVIERVTPMFGLPYFPIAGPFIWIFVAAYGIGFCAVLIPIVHTSRHPERGPAVQQMRVFSIIVVFALLGGLTNLPGAFFVPLAPYAMMVAPVSICAMTALLWPRSTLLTRLNPARLINRGAGRTRLGSYFEDYPSAYLSYNLVAAIIAILFTPILVVAGYGVEGLSDGGASIRVFLCLCFLILLIAAILPGIQRFVRGWTEVDSPAPTVIATAARQRDSARVVDTLSALLGGAPMVLYKLSPALDRLEMVASSLLKPSAPQSLFPKSPVLIEAMEERTFFSTDSLRFLQNPREIPSDWNWAIPVVEGDSLVLIAFAVVNNEATSRRSLEKALTYAQIILYQYSFNETHQKLMARRASDSSLLQTGQLAAKLAHELRTPLSILDIYFAQSRELVNLMNRAEPTDAVSQILAAFNYDIGEVAAQGERFQAARRRVESALDTTRPFTDAQSKPSTISMETLVEDVEKLCQSELAEASATLILEMPTGVMLGMGRATGLQIFSNLVRNSAEAIEEAGGGGYITIRGQVDGDAFRVWVKDTGPGLPLSVLDALESGNPVTSSKVAQKWRSRGSGHGLGLTLVRDNIQALGSRLVYCLEERAFSFTLPLPRSGG